MTTDLTASSTAVEDCTFERNRAFRGSSLFGVRSVNRCRFEGGIGAGAIFSNNYLAVHTIRDSYLTHSVVYMVNTNLEMSGTWRCGDSPVVFEVAGSLADLGATSMLMSVIATLIGRRMRNNSKCQLPISTATAFSTLVSASPTFRAMG